MRRLELISTAGLLSVLLLVTPSLAQHKHDEGRAGAAHAHARFDDPEKWSTSFDDPARDKWQKPQEVVKALGLRRNSRVADVGAGTGYFTVRLARAVPGGLAYAVDIEPKMVMHVAERASALGLGNVRAVQGSDASPDLPEPVDLVLLVNAYHHISERPAYFRKLTSSLRPGGRIAIIDYRPDAKRGAPKHMRLAVETIDKEMKEAGYARAASHNFLPEQSFVVYRIAGK